MPSKQSNKSGETKESKQQSLFQQQLQMEHQYNDHHNLSDSEEDEKFVKLQADDGAWEVVTDTRKQKRQQRKIAKAEQEAEDKEKEKILQQQQQQQSQLLTSSSNDNNSNNSNNVQSSKLVQDKDDDSSSDDNNNSNGVTTRLSKKKKKASRPPGLAVSNEKELADVIADFLHQSPNNTMKLSAIGDKLQAVTKQSWNKKFKKRYGTILSFVSRRGEFVVRNNDQVYLVPHNKPVADNSNSNSKKKGEKSSSSSSSSSSYVPSSSSPSYSSHSRHSHSHSSKSQSSKGSSGGDCWTVLAVLLVLLAVVAAFLFSSGQSPASLLDKLNKRK